MKRIVLVLAVLLVAAPSFADDQSSGCGLGWSVFKKNSLISSYSRNITNLVASNSSAMTTGSSGCAKHDLIMREKAAQYYAEANFQKLQTEFAEGQGEHLTAFANILGCFGNAGEVFQNNYETIFPSQNANPTQMLDSVKASLRTSASVSCATGV